jgi:hypothetical protein
MAPTIAPKINPTLRTSVGSTAGARDGSPAPEGGSAAAKCQKTAEGKIPRVSSNFDGVRRRANPPRLATAKATTDMILGRLTTAKAAADAKGPEVIPSDDDDEPIDDATLRPCKVGRTMPGDKPTAIRKTAPGTSAKLRLGVASDKTLAVTRAGTPTAMRLTMDDDDNDDDDKDVAIALARATALGNDRLIGSLAPAGRILSTSTTAPGKATKLRVGAGPDGTRAVARAGMPKGVHLTMDDDNENVNDATAVGMARLRSIVGATDRGPATATEGAAPAGEYRLASGGLAAEENFQGKTGQGGSAANFLFTQKRQ